MSFFKSDDERVNDSKIHAAKMDSPSQADTTDTTSLCLVRSNSSCPAPRTSSGIIKEETAPSFLE